jgi:hypothetical protein
VDLEIWFSESIMTDPKFLPPDLPQNSLARYEGGRHWTPPDPVIIAAFLFIVAKNLIRFNVGIAAWALMGTHPHLFAFDRDPTGPSQVWKFRQQVHAQLAQFLRAYWKLDEKLFSDEMASELFPILDSQRCIETIVYIMTNPVAANIVASPYDMPEGAVGLPSMYEKPLIVERPDFWFDPRNWPETYELRLEVPPLVDASPKQMATLTEAAVRIRCEALQKERVAEDIKLLGVEHALAKTPFEEGKQKKSTGTIVCSGSDKAIKAKFYLAYRRFLRAYRRAMESVRQGNREALFPWGTGKMASCNGFAMYVPPG